MLPVHLQCLVYCLVIYPPLSCVLDRCSDSSLKYNCSFMSPWVVNNKLPSIIFMGVQRWIQMRSAREAAVNREWWSDVTTQRECAPALAPAAEGRDVIHRRGNGCRLPTLSFLPYVAEFSWINLLMVRSLFWVNGTHPILIRLIRLWHSPMQWILFVSLAADLLIYHRAVNANQLLNTNDNRLRGDLSANQWSSAPLKHVVTFTAAQFKMFSIAK